MDVEELREALNKIDGNTKVFVKGPYGTIYTGIELVYTIRDTISSSVTIYGFYSDNEDN